MTNTTEQTRGFFIKGIIWLLTAARKVRLPGLSLLLIASFINCYFILFDQQNYIVFLERFSPDGNISDVNNVFIRIQTLIIYLCIAWMLATKQSIIAPLVDLSKMTKQPNLHWSHKKTPYIIACIIWLAVSYLPYLFFDSETIRMLTKEESFYENAGFLWLLISSISFFYLFFRGEKSCKFFFLFGLLFLFGAGEEINWGQRIFDFKTPEIFSSNTQQATSIHNLKVFDWDKENPKKGLAQQLIISYQYENIFIFYSFILPLLYELFGSVRRWLKQINLPISPIWIGVFFLVNYYLSGMLTAQSDKTMGHPLAEIKESAFCFFFVVISAWMINNSKLDQPSRK